MKDRFKLKFYSNKYRKVFDVVILNTFLNIVICDVDISLQEDKDNPVFEFHIRDGVLLQCTGLKDKNGKLIFESDRIGHFNNIVEYYNGTFTVNCDMRLSAFLEYEIIGNIYENPELLEAQ